MAPQPKKRRFGTLQRPTDFANKHPELDDSGLLDVLDRKFRALDGQVENLNAVTGANTYVTPGGSGGGNPPVPPVPPEVDIIDLICLKVPTLAGSVQWDFVNYNSSDGARFADCSTGVNIVATHVIVRIVGPNMWISTFWNDGGSNPAADRGGGSSDQLYQMLQGKVTDDIADLRYTTGPQKGRLLPGIAFVQRVGRKLGPFLGAGSVLPASDYVEAEQR